jgi:hypothetical protein
MSDLIIFNSAKEQIDALAVACKRVVVKNVESLDYAKELVKKSKQIEKAIEDKRKEVTAPLVEEKRKLDNIAKRLTEDLSAAIKELRSQILAFEAELERQRLEKLRAIEEEKRRQEAEAETSIDASIKSLQLAAEAKELQSEKSKSLRKVWKYEVVDEILVPREYMSVSDVKIKAAVTAGIREIAGVRIFQKEQLVLR